MTVLYIYFAMTGLTFCAGALSALYSDDRDERRLWARVALTAPGWPIWVGLAAWWSVRFLLREAEWLR